MKRIAKDVETGFVATRPHFNDLLPAFSWNFSVTWARERVSHNTKLTVFLLKPDSDISQMFGFDKEIPLFVSQYDKLEPRVAQGIEQICNESPLAGRVDPSIVFLHSPAPDLESWVANYLAENPQSRMLVPFSSSIIRKGVDDAWIIKNNIKNNLFIRNLFDYKLPIKSDRFFYGREDIVASIYDNIKKSQNSGLFGLRKTGKTSVLLKIMRHLNRAKDAYCVFFDCKYRPIRNSTCDDFIWKIIKEIDSINATNFSKQKDVEDCFITLKKAVESSGKGRKICIIFDEIEYISPISSTNLHWAADFIDLWQGLWSIQTETDKICFVVCGVNPTVCDVDRFNSPTVPGRTVQNPMFGIFNIYYLRGFDEESLRNMISFFGRRMGLNFTRDAVAYLHQRYGGHPLLCRLACSYHHEQFLAAEIDRPIQIDAQLLQGLEDDRESELSPYCEHVISEIRELYPEEFEMLQMLARGNKVDYYELSADNSLVRHIREYGLVSAPEEKMAVFSIPVVGEYLRKDAARKSGNGQSRYFVREENRDRWLSTRKRSIISDMSILNRQLVENGHVGLFPGDSPGKIVEFYDVPVVKDEQDAIAFLVAANKVLVENVDRHLKKNKRDFFKDLESIVPFVYDALMRIRVYRNKFCHVEMNALVEKKCIEYLKKDFNSLHPEASEDGWFLLQQIVLDELHLALQIETSKM